MLVEVVTIGTGTARLPENLPVTTTQHFGEVTVIRLLLNLDEVRTQCPRTTKTADDVPTLRLDQREVGGTVVAVGTEDVEMIGESGDTDPFEGLQSMLVPPCGLLQPAASLQHVRWHVARLHHFEAGGQDQDVNGMSFAVSRMDGCMVDMGYAARLERNVGPVVRCEIGIVEAGSFTAQRVARNELFSRRRVMDFTPHVPLCGALHDIGERYHRMKVSGDWESDFYERLARGPGRQLRPWQEM